MFGEQIMIHEKQLDYYAILKLCVDDTIHPSNTRYSGDEIAIFVGPHKLYLKADQKGNLYYKLPAAKSDKSAWIQWNKVSDLTSMVNSSFGSFGWEFSLFLRWIYEKYADTLNVGIENRVWSMDLFYKTRLLIVEKLEHHIIDSTLVKLTVNIDNRAGSKPLNTVVQFNYYSGCLEVGGIGFSPHDDTDKVTAKLNRLKVKYAQLGNPYNIINYLTDCIFTAYTQVSPSIGIEQTMTDPKHTHDDIELGQSTFKPYVPDASDPNSPQPLMSNIFSALHSSTDWLQLGEDLTFRCTKEGNLDTFLTFCHESAPDGGTLLKYVRDDVEWLSEYTISLDIDNLRAKGDEVLLPLLEEVFIPNILQRIARPLTKSIPSVSFVDYIREQDKLCYRLMINESIGQTILKSTSDANDKFTVRSNFINTPEKEMNIQEFLSWANSANLEPAVSLIAVVDLLNRTYK